ncbi:hypothetical protein [Coxiella-like endosymbiont]|uniref:hypothetical protein n=1 Tax=Coxiella-like endosymbiont TaxID=1592897 RepID=UPI00272A11E4|nr:hypothetical protein [Coxiella-like endosymbiont]
MLWLEDIQLKDSPILGKMYIQQAIRENFEINNNILSGRRSFPQLSLNLPSRWYDKEIFL